MIDGLIERECYSRTCWYVHDIGGRACILSTNVATEVGRAEVDDGAVI